MAADLFNLQAREHIHGGAVGIGCSFGFTFCGSFFDGRTVIMRQLLPAPLVDISSVEVLLCAINVE